MALALCVFAGCASVESPRPTPVDLGHLERSVVAAPVLPAANTDDPDEKPAWGKGRGKSYWVPAAGIIGFDALLNIYDRNAFDGGDFDSDWDSFERNLHTGWVIDKDPFATNQVGHPYQGSMYHGFARSAGMNYWEAFAYDFLGSALWETAGETTPPSFNDQITTSFGGSFFGEALYRMANHFLSQKKGRPDGWRELGAALISPATGFNRAAFGKRFDAIYPGRDPATFSSFGLGARQNAKVKDLGVLSDTHKDEALVQFEMDYGLPGKSGYEYRRPFDYFHFEASTTSSFQTFPENIVSRGLLVGSDTQAGKDYRGLWGLFGSYEYFSPQIFSVSSTALMLGNVGQWNISHSVAMQSTLLAGAGWAAAGTIADARTDRDYHSGLTPQGLLGFRFIFGDSVMFAISGSDYYIDGSASDGGGGQENIFRGKASLTVRVYERHALALQFVTTSRDADFSTATDSFQSVGALSLVYSYLSNKKFGAVEW